ncbi:tRNA (adenosine(37)-N6)-threonylcarbamoyltransferase complex ATPase subunit type 1 TsaE [Corynebacterium mendelii]|uniref:tRNA threonylcarbamoyladenosine biosynthesis protein TsaE n=1 Tax=Corynebacterium mendelii TaxID=2765362 RepID=A0A939IXV7_9CORY|nr:tRNA (adenosine(37)-N6)-threonylcarbamoyltransferase complex ATPase subunit type 1 TsaE [Corynebacterium mendelii]MBN9644047.1 tRNA (adenosine(37)-N6)-threonylcarbamoyltransferase complex ATPase subunit type 1 TsaE [Corynebacterium mendelii]
MQDCPSAHTSRCETSTDTRQLGKKFAAGLSAGDVVILDGPLGAGKTTFTQGIAEGLQVRGKVTSPTFVIARQHRSTVGGPELIHVDAYRLIGDGDSGGTDPVGALDSLDLDTDLMDAVVVAEWGGGLVEQITDSYWLVTFDRTTAVVADPDSHARIISWQRKHTG